MVFPMTRASVTSSQNLFNQFVEIHVVDTKALRSTFYLREDRYMPPLGKEVHLRH